MRTRKSLENNRIIYRKNCMLNLKCRKQIGCPSQLQWIIFTLSAIKYFSWLHRCKCLCRKRTNAKIISNKNEKLKEKSLFWFTWNSNTWIFWFVYLFKRYKSEIRTRNRHSEKWWNPMCSIYPSLVFLVLQNCIGFLRKCYCPANKKHNAAQWCRNGNT